MKSSMLRSVLAAALLLFFYSCASVPRIAEDADPLAMLPADSSLIVSLPVVAQRQGIEKLMPEFFQGDLSMVMNRAARVTLSQRPLRSGDQVHLVFEGRYSSTAIYWGLRPRDGWQRLRLDDGRRYYHQDQLAVILIAPGTVYVVAGNSPELELADAIRRSQVFSGGHEFPVLSAEQETGRIWWRDTEALIGPDAMKLIPALFRNSFNAEGSFDFFVFPEGDVYLNGSLVAENDIAARVLNTSLRALLPQILQGQSRPGVYRDAKTVYLEDVVVESDIAEGWVRPMLEDFL